MKRRMGNQPCTPSSNVPKTDDSGSCYSDVPPLPLVAVEEILNNIPAEQVVCTCRLVCHEWRDMVDSSSLWRERCRREGLLPRDPTKSINDWRLFYFLCKKRRNLLKNPKAEEKFSGWEITQNGGDRWKIEGLMSEHPDKTVSKNFVTSYFLCMKRQVINLNAEGYSSSFIDEFQPDILISDWYAPRFDCGCEYELIVNLLCERSRVLRTFRPEKAIFHEWNDQKWNQVTHVFRNYGKGVRFIEFIHGGKDTKFWAGWYGIRVTNSSVEICPTGER